MIRFILLPGLLLAIGICSLAQESTIAPGENLVVDDVPFLSALFPEVT